MFVYKFIKNSISETRGYNKTSADEKTNNFSIKIIQNKKPRATRTKPLGGRLHNINLRNLSINRINAAPPPRVIYTDEKYTIKYNEVQLEQ